MKDNYEQAIAFVFKYEGGYANNPRDPGGPTNRGITLATARAFWKHDATAADVKAMPKSVAEEIYKKQYADKINFDSLPSGLDLCALDAAVMSGPKRANDWLIKANTIDDYQALRLAFYKSLKIYPTFGKGWTNRVNSGTTLAKALQGAIGTSTVSTTINTTNNIPNVNKNTSLSPTSKTVGGVIATGGTLAAIAPYHYLPYILGATAIVMVAGYILVKYIQWRHGKTN